MNWPTDSWGLRAACVASRDADCTRRQVGAATFDPNGKLVGVGANRGPDGEPGCTAGACPRGRHTYAELPSYVDGNHDYSDCIATHAEVRAGAVDGGTMYITDKPCRGCMTFITSSKLARAVWPGGEWNRRNHEDV